MNFPVRNSSAQDSRGELDARPKYLKDFVGQGANMENLKIFIQAARNRGEPLDHILIYGPPGLGKTTLSHIIANELNVNIKAMSGPLINKVGELAAILSNLKANEVLFVDEIHRMNKNVEEVLYSALESFYIDLIIGDGPTAKSYRMQIPRFTFIGATTRTGMLTKPLKDRFGIPLKLDFYSVKELELIVKNVSQRLGMVIEMEGCEFIAKASRGTPRISIRLLRRIRDLCEIKNGINSTISRDMVGEALSALKIDNIGLDSLDYKYMTYLVRYCRGTPIGIESIATALSESVDTVEDDIEPYLIQIGFITKTPRGRIVTFEGVKYFESLSIL
ncbi:Holliday junction branch migration DNA helicase RuvB [Candidatus Fokinia crypta]|uniref:Holliday junction branch migration DNA helicase RuvB n=1 Tax=Candidatus Fokinia crypta TaxID=1920990 RepID=UPI002B25894E|nr:Holliday junction branch migration DNA helicase RuvB [Candidatus Fokinia cryptica]